MVGKVSSKLDFWICGIDIAGSFSWNMPIVFKELLLSEILFGSLHNEDIL